MIHNYTKSTRQLQRLKAKIKQLILGRNALFITLTFNNDILEHTNEETRERYIKTFLKENCAIYIANKDYGKENEREHYHAIIKAFTFNNESLKEQYKSYYSKLNFDNYKYGTITAKYINNFSLNNNKSIDLCITKLISHLYKDTTKKSRIIYSRVEQAEKEQIKRIKTLKIQMEKPKVEESNEDVKKFILDDLEEHEENFKKFVEEKTKTLKYPNSFYFKYEPHIIFKYQKHINETTLLYKAIYYDYALMVPKQKNYIYEIHSEIHYKFLGLSINQNITFN